MKFILTTLALVFTFNARAEFLIYTDQPASRMDRALDILESQTDEIGRFVEAPYAELLKRIDQGFEKPDIIITKDLIFMQELANRGLLKAMTPSPALARVIPYMRDRDYRWTALTYKVRAVAYDPLKVKASELTTYEDLATSKWKNRLCVRAHNNTYNEALAAWMMIAYGPEKARAIIQGWLGNLQQPAFLGDLEAIKAVQRGECEVAIVNQYYLAGHVIKNPDVRVKFAFLNQDSTGVHSDGSGAGIMSWSQSPNAQLFIEILLGDEMQTKLTNLQYNYPVVQPLAFPQILQDWGAGFKRSPISWTDIGNQGAAARQMLEDVGFSHGPNGQHD